MSSNLLAVWKSTSKSDTDVLIMPDGCRDLIMKIVEGNRPEWFVSSLYDQAKSVSIQAGSIMTGFRLKPGVYIREKALLNSIPGNLDDAHEISNRLDDFTHHKSFVEEALDCLASEVKSVTHAASELGVSQRTLQRLLLQETSRPPVYWMMLARVRRTARSILEPIPLIEIADMFGYSDQAHMSREFKRWFNMSPSDLRNKPDILEQLFNTGHD